MKRWLPVLLAVLVVCSLVSCSRTVLPTEGIGIGSATTPATVPETASVTEAVTEPATEPETEPAIVPALLITEIAFNPTYSADEVHGIVANADVFPYIEVYNPGDKPVSLSGYTLICRQGGFDADALTDRILAPSGNEMTLSPGEIAILAVYNAYAPKLGLGYATDGEIDAFRDAFCAFYGVTVPVEHFFICPYVESGTDTPIAGSFKLSHDADEIVYQLADADGAVVNEVHYCQKEWNRNNRACLFAFPDGGAEAGHPLSSQVLGSVVPTPYTIADNQIYQNAALVPTEPTVPIKLLEYNICASGIDYRAEGMTEKQSIAYRSVGVTDYLTSEHPDVIVLCEFNYAWVPYISKWMTKQGYGAYGYAGSGTEYSALKSTQWDICNLILWDQTKYECVESGYFWLSSNPDIRSAYWSDGTQSDFARTVNWVVLREKQSGAEFVVFGIHLPVAKDQYLAAQKHSVELILSRAAQHAEKMPVLIAGDWNTTDSTEAYGVAAASSFADVAYRTTDTWLGASITAWGDYLTSLLNRAAIDHVFISEGTVFAESFRLDPVEFEEGITGSDHGALIARLQIAVRR